MIQRTIPTWQDLSWQDELKALITDPAKLITMLKLDPSLLPAAQHAASLFQLRVTPSFVSRIKPGDMHDPLLKQILPLAEELQHTTGFSADPLDESAFNPQKGLVHKYKGRVLIIAATSCAINCRYCFRREFSYSENRLTKSDWQNTLNYIETHTELEEVIFSGGDPLLQSDKQYAWLLEALADIPHIERVRIHTRLPVVLPSRITDTLLSAFTSTRLKPVWVIHCNHAQEIDSAVASALAKIHQAGITLLNQAVLLNGVNDNLEAQVQLSKTLFQHNVLPYYLHTLDKVSGAAHFDTKESDAIALYNTMRAALSGYLLPKLVKETPGEYAKTPIPYH